MRLSVILCVLFAAAALVSGCGGGGGSATESSGTGASTAGDSTTATEKGGGDSGKEEAKPSKEKEEFIKAGDEICSEVPTHYTNNLEKLKRESGKKEVPKTESNVKAAVPPIFTAMEQFKRLDPPSGERRKVEEIIIALEHAARGIEIKPESELSGPKSPFAEFQKMTKEYGFQVCSNL